MCNMDDFFSDLSYIANYWNSDRIKLLVENSRDLYLQLIDSSFHDNFSNSQTYTYNNKKFLKICLIWNKQFFYFFFRFWKPPLFVIYDKFRIQITA